MQTCDDECGACDQCIEYLMARADDARDEWLIEDARMERHFE